MRLEIDVFFFVLQTSRRFFLSHPFQKELKNNKKNRYTPAAGDTVVGVIVDRRGDGYSVDIRGGTTGGGGGGGCGEASASLPALAFEGATRRSRPTLRAGDAVFCRVAAAQRHVEAELTCMDEAGRAGGLGPLGPGAVVEVTTAHARALLAATGAAAAAAGAASSKKASSSASSSSSASASNTSVSPIVAALAATGLPFEVAVGANGRVWVGGPDAAAVSAAARALEGSDGVLDAREAEAIARRAVEAVRAAGGTR